MSAPVYKCDVCDARPQTGPFGDDECPVCDGDPTPPDVVPNGLTGELLGKGVRFTEHARKRWDERVPTGAVNPEDAWQLGVEASPEWCARIETQEGDTPDRARVFRGRGAEENFTVIFLCSDTPNPTNDPEWTNVVTCYLAESSNDPALRRYYKALAYEQEVVA